LALLFPRGAFDEPQHLANRDGFRKPCQVVAASHAPVRLHKPPCFSDDKIDSEIFWGSSAASQMLAILMGSSVLCEARSKRA